MSENKITPLQLKEILEFLGDMYKVQNFLRTDAQKANEKAMENINDECWRRMTIRTTASFIEALCYFLKHSTLHLHQIMNVKLNDKQIGFLTGVIKDEKTGEKKPFKTSVEDNIKKTFKEFAGLWGKKYYIADDKKWSIFRDFIGIRHRITHPKSSTDLEVSVDDFCKAGDSFQWFSLKFGELVDTIKSSNRYPSQLEVKLPKIKE